jgi:hypothetical protein
LIELAITSINESAMGRHGQHLIQSRMHRDLRIVAALALPLSAARPWQEASSVDRA